MVKEEKAKVFMSGRSQAVRIPAAYRFKTEEVYVHRDEKTGDLTLSENKPLPSLQEVFRMLDEAIAIEGPLELDRDMRPAEDREWM